MAKVVPCIDCEQICEKIDQLIRTSLMAFIFELAKNKIRAYWYTLKAYCQITTTNFNAVLIDYYENHLNTSSKATISCADFIDFMQSKLDLYS